MKLQPEFKLANASSEQLVLLIDHNKHSVLTYVDFISVQCYSCQISAFLFVSHKNREKDLLLNIMSPDELSA